MTAVLWVAAVLQAGAFVWAVRATDACQPDPVPLTARGWAVITALGVVSGLLIGVLLFDGYWLSADWR